RSVAPGGGTIRIETDDGALEANAAVVAAGAWAVPLLAAAGIDLPVVPTRETVAYFDLGGKRTVPSVIDHRGRETYALTAAPGRLKVGIHRTGPATDPDEAGVADETIVRAASGWAASTFRLESPEPVAVETCLYT